MTLAELLTSLQAKGYGSDTAPSQTSAINDVYRRIAGMRRWAWLEQVTTSLTTTFNVPSVSLTPVTTLMWVDAVRIEIGTEYDRLKHIPIQELRDLEHLDRTPGVPRYWTEAFGEIRLYPRPDRVYTVTLDYITTPPPLVLTTDVPAFDSTFHDILVWGAIADGMAFRQRDWAGEARAQAKFDTRLREMQQSYGLAQRQNSTHVGQWSGWDDVALPG